MNLDGDVFGCILGNIPARSSNGLLHFSKYMQTTIPGLGQGPAHYLPVNPIDLDIHLQGGNAFPGTDNLEIHITKMIFIAENIGQHDDLVILLDQTHGHSGDRALDGHTGIHQGKAAAADRGHG